MISFLVFVITWFVVGWLTALMTLMSDMRMNAINHVSPTIVGISILLIVIMGYISPLFIFYYHAKGELK